MADKREGRGLADIIATVISPILIMAMVGSLIFFLIEVLYGGDYAGRMRWSMFFFVFGAVLIARISIEMGDGKATLYAIALGFAAFLAMLRFVEYAPGSFLDQFGWLVNIGLLALVWWCARKLTWDCTFIDDSRDASDRSLLEATGLENLERPEEWREPEEEEEVKFRKRDNWWERYAKWRQAEDKKPHTPGVWVVYFSLAALPIFGLGQALIPSEEGESRHFTFWLMALYVGSGLGLLMTTAFLGLRRYLKQRNLRIPTSMAGLWLGIGAGIILLFLTVAAILPRPSSETPLINISAVGSKERDASEYAQKGDGQGKGEGNAGDQSSEKSESKNSAEGKSQEGGKGKGQDNSTKGSGENKGKGGNSGKSDQKGNQKGGDQNSDKSENNPNQSKNDQKTNDDAGKDRKDKGSGSNSKSSSSGSKSKKSSSRNSSSKGPSQMPQLGKIGSILKWIVFGVLALVVAYFVFRHGLKILANFSQWAKNLLESLNNFWANLFGRREVADREPDEKLVAAVRAPRPFADFRNPFDTGDDAGRSPAELVTYSFAALEAWAWEHERGRDQQETPLEFARRLAGGSEALKEEAPRLAMLYARLAYARGKLPEASRAHVKEFWRQLELAHEEVLIERKAETADA
ncbi:MAG: DUF4129 domain-containing protein [Gemmataceae bacterium]